MDLEATFVDDPFLALNLYVFNRTRGVFYDAVIWCLGPLADESRDYGYLRSVLAFATCRVCRLWIATP